MDDKPKNYSPDLMLSTIGFKLTPAIQARTISYLKRLESASSGIVRIRAKLKFFDNGPRRDTFQVRLRIEQRGPDLVTVREGHDLYQLLRQTAHATLERIRQTTDRKQRRKRDRQKLSHTVPGFA